MVVRRSSTVRVEARQRARQRTAERREERRKREQRVDELVEQHADALARVEEVRQRAEQEIAEHRTRADRMVSELLALGETAGAVAGLLDMSPAEVRAARKRARAAGDGEVRAEGGEAATGLDVGEGVAGTAAAEDDGTGAASGAAGQALAGAVSASG